MVTDGGSVRRPSRTRLFVVFGSAEGSCPTVSAKEESMADSALVQRKPSPEEFIALLQAAGWHVPDPDAVAAALANTCFAACVERDGQCVGSGRVVGDGALVFYVQDLIVLPDFQRRGYGTMLMDAIMDYIHRNARPTAVIGLFSARGLEPWYARYGFIERPHKRLGPGMVFIKE